MNLLEFREKFREVSGRFDLVNEDFTDNGADFYINEGRKFLDRLDETQKSWAVAYRFMEIDGFAVHFQDCRAIKEVWAATTSARWQLEKNDLPDLIAGYMTTLPSGMDSGTPLYYSPAITWFIPENVTAEDFESFLGYVDVSAGNAYGFNSILIMAPTDEKLSIEVKGLFYSHPLTDETDENYWTVSNPMLLIMSTMRQIEVINRNTQGVNDWTNSIAIEAKQLGMDMVEEMISEVSQIKD
jgi:hypothetical protein